MARHLWITAAVLLGCLVGLSCKKANPPAWDEESVPLGDLAPGQTPVPPLELPAPPPPPATLDGEDLSQLSAKALVKKADEYERAKDYPHGAPYQYWFVKKSGRGQYNLACYLARLGQTDPAFYWLQVAGLEEGVNAPWADRDPDLETLRADPRWQAVRRYLYSCATYWGRNPVTRSTVVVPAGYDGKKPLTVVLGLHATNMNPDDFTQDCFQKFADELHVAFVCVSGTRTQGKWSFAWSEQPEQDYQRLRQALDEAKGRVTPRPGGLIAFGFSQGGLVALQAAARYPEEFAGAIIASPAGNRPPLAGQGAPSPLLAKRGFVLVCGEEEPSSVRMAMAAGVDWLRRAGAQVERQAYPGVSAHALPADFEKRFPEWVRFIESAAGR